MKNQDFLDKIIELYKLIHINDIIFLIYPNVVYLSYEVLKRFESNHTENILGKSYLEILPIPKENHPQIIYLVSILLEKYHI